MIGLMFFGLHNAFAENFDKAVEFLMTEGGMSNKAAIDEVQALVDQMDAAQTAAQNKYDEIKSRVEGMHDDNSRKDDAEDALEDAKSVVDDFTGLTASDDILVYSQAGSAVPVLRPGDSFSVSQANAAEAMGGVNQILILPDRPGDVPEGGIIDRFIPQLIRQLFRFAWVAVLVSLTVSGIMFVIAFDNEERITKAKHMILYSMVGFALVALSFAIVKAVTDIDFFAFI